MSAATPAEGAPMHLVRVGCMPGRRRRHQSYRNRPPLLSGFSPILSHDREHRSDIRRQVAAWRRMDASPDQRSPLACWASHARPDTRTRMVAMPWAARIASGLRGSSPLAWARSRCCASERPPPTCSPASTPASRQLGPVEARPGRIVARSHEIGLTVARHVGVPVESDAPVNRASPRSPARSVSGLRDGGGSRASTQL